MGTYVVVADESVNVRFFVTEEEEFVNDNILDVVGSIIPLPVSVIFCPPVRGQVSMTLVFRLLM